MATILQATTSYGEQRRLIEHAGLKFRIPSAFDAMSIDPVIIVPTPFIPVGDPQVHDRGTDCNLLKVTVVALRITFSVNGPRHRNEEWGLGTFFQLVPADPEEVEEEQQRRRAEASEKHTTLQLLGPVHVVQDLKNGLTPQEMVAKTFQSDDRATLIGNRYVVAGM